MCGGTVECGHTRTQHTGATWEGRKPTPEHMSETSKATDLGLPDILVAPSPQHVQEVVRGVEDSPGVLGLSVCPAGFGLARGLLLLCC